MRIRLAALASGAVLSVCGGAGAGSYAPPPGDTAPSWSPDGTKVAFHTFRDGGGVKIALANGSGEDWLVREPVIHFAVAPDWSKIALVVQGTLFVSALDGSGKRAVVDTNRPGVPAWAPDSRQLAFTASDSGIYVIDVEGTAQTRFLTHGFSPTWSPDGLRLAYVSQVSGTSNVHVVNADGSGDVNLTPGSPQPSFGPAWAPDGSRVALWIDTGRVLVLDVLHLDGTGRSYQIHGAATPFAWRPDGRAIVYWRSQEFGGIHPGLVRLDLASGKEQQLTVGYDGEPAFSRDGRRLAFISGRECRDRIGVYTARADGRSARRVSNDCRIVGTKGDDVLRGTPLADVLDGLAGDDTLFAVDSGYIGDTLHGGAGDDMLAGAYSRDTLIGGTGDDRLWGGPSGDRLLGGHGRDRFYGQGGRDVIYADDGRRDVIFCGTNAPGTPEQDEVFADRFDRVAPDCERVRR